MSNQYDSKNSAQLRPGRPWKNRGVTVLELLITLAIVALALSLAIPGYSAFLHKNDIRAASNLLHTTLNVARIEAVKRRQSIRICPSADGGSCRNDGNWSDGWLVFEDLNSNDLPDASEIIQLVESLEHGVAIEVSASIDEYLQFEPTGIAVGNAGLAGEFRICHDDSAVYSQKLGVSAAGQVRLQQRIQLDCSAAG